MARYTTPDQQYFDSSGNVLTGGKLYFYSTGTVTALDTYSDVNLSIPRTNPVILDASGRTGNIFLKEQSYKVKLTDSTDVLIFEADPVTSDLSVGNFSSWNSLTIYSAGDYVTGSNGDNYESIAANNQNNDPTAAVTHWQRVQLIPTWNSLVTYTDDSIVIGSNGLMYSSTIASNLNNDPVSDVVNWRDPITASDPSPPAFILGYFNL